MNAMVMLPTYNERENIEELISSILACDTGISVVVVDDNSPDGTGELVEELAEGEPRIHLISRKNEKGRGSAGIRGFIYALDAGADHIIEMDCDWSHHPKYLAEMLRLNRMWDVVIGSRLTPGGGETGRGVTRRLITLFANRYIQMVMGVRVADCTSGFRCFKREVLKGIGLESMNSTGPSIVEEILYSCAVNGFKIKEIPILFEERRFGTTTKDIWQYMDTMFRILMFRVQRRKYRVRRREVR